MSEATAFRDSYARYGRWEKERADAAARIQAVQRGKQARERVAEKKERRDRGEDRPPQLPGEKSANEGGRKSVPDNIS